MNIKFDVKRFENDDVISTSNLVYETCFKITDISDGEVHIETYTGKDDVTGDSGTFYYQDDFEEFLNNAYGEVISYKKGDWFVMMLDYDAMTARIYRHDDKTSGHNHIPA